MKRTWIVNHWHSQSGAQPLAIVYAVAMADGQPQRDIRRPDRPVAAARLALETGGLVYRKWGGEQRAKSGDWIVDNDGDVYTVDADVFSRTYRQTGTGAFVKTTPVWAQRATNAGSVKTKEGSTQYEPGDYLVSNNNDGSDEYAMKAAKFEDLYTADDS